MRLNILKDSQYAAAINTGSRHIMKYTKPFSDSSLMSKLRESTNHDATHASSIVPSIIVIDVRTN